MKFYFSSLVLTLSIMTTACKNTQDAFDASGSFEADEIIVSSETSGKIISLQIQEGIVLAKDTLVGKIDPLPVQLQKEQVEASMQALSQRTMDVTPQIALLQQQLAVQQTQLKTILKEKDRFEKLVQAEAATVKQLDDISAQADVLKQQIEVTRKQMILQQSTTASQNRSILSEQLPLQKRKSQLEDQELRNNIINPRAGTVITQYAKEGEVTAAGKALYKLADLSMMNLRVYITATQLSQMKLGQEMNVYADQGSDAYKEYKGVIYWIADKAEFTPKTIQTKEERANLVYAVKLKVKNDGYLKIGMFGAVKL